MGGLEFELRDLCLQSYVLNGRQSTNKLIPTTMSGDLKLKQGEVREEGQLGWL
jgi:hypothetical protein